MTSLTLPLISSTAKFPQTAPERTVNLYGDKAGQSNFVLKRTPGLALFGVLAGSGGIRGVLRFKGTTERLFAVRGNSFQEWDTFASAFVSRGTLASLVGMVGMAYNTTQVIVVDADKAYVYDVGNPASFAQITGAGGFNGTYAFPGGNSAAIYASLRMFSIGPNTGEVWASNRDDARTWDPIATIEAETFPDPAVALANLGPSMLVFGTDSFETWVDQGLPTFPFRRVQAGSSIGCSAPSSVSVYGGEAYWLGGSTEGRGIVYKSRGVQAAPISTPDIDRIIAGLPSFDDAVGFIYQEQGHAFYVLTFGVGDTTLVYDLATGLWLEWEFRNGDGTISRHPAIAQAVYQGANLVGDFRNGNIYTMSKAYLDNGGLPIVHEKIFIVWPSDTFEFTNMPPFYVAMDVGQAASGADEPLAMLSFSDDRGKTYGIEHYRGLGRTGQYDRRVVWDGLGSSFGRAYRLRLQGAVDFVVRGAGML